MINTVDLIETYEFSHIFEEFSHLQKWYSVKIKFNVGELIRLIRLTPLSCC